MFLISFIKAFILYYFYLLKPFFINQELKNINDCRYWSFKEIFNLWNYQPDYYKNLSVKEWTVAYAKKFVNNNYILSKLYKIFEFRIVFFLISLTFPFFGFLIALKSLVLEKKYNNFLKKLVKRWSITLKNPEFFIFTPSLDYKYELFKKKYNDCPEEYMSYFIIKILSTIQSSKVDDKMKLYLDCKNNNDIKTIPILFKIDKDGCHVIEQLKNVKSFFIKLVNGGTGDQAYRVDLIDNKYYIAKTENKEIKKGFYNSWNQMIEYFITDCQMYNRSYIIQPCIENHPKIYELTKNRTLVNARISTYKFLDKNVGARVNTAKLYLTLEDSIVSQSKKRIILCINLDDYSFYKAYSVHENKYVEELNGINLLEHKIPYIKEAFELCKKAHDNLPICNKQKDDDISAIYIGWDVAITENGPLLIEGNTPCGVNLLEQDKQPNGKSDFGKAIIERCNYYRIKRSKNIYLYFKSIMDRILGFIFLLVSTPVILFWIIFIYYKERENPVFIQKRLGKDGKPFNIIKLRSMKDEKVTNIGKIIRKYRFDEMPQFINIVKGDMSLCGPRPLIPKEYEGEDKLFYKRLLVKPGITGWAQINGPLKDVKDKKYYDNYYIKNISSKLDMFIIYHTAKTVFTGKRLRDKNQHYEPILEK